MGFKAFLVGVDREACALYKQALDKYLPPEYSEVVYSEDNRDSALMKSYYHTTEQEKDIRKRFINKNEHPEDFDCNPEVIDRFRCSDPLLHVP